MKTGLLVLVLGFDAVERVTEEALLHRSPKRERDVSSRQVDFREKIRLALRFPRDTPVEMSGENVDIIRRLIPANKKSQEECLPYLAPDLEIVPMDHFPDRTIFHGPSGWERWSTRWTSMFDEHELTIGRTWEAGDQVVVELSERVKSAGSSFPLVNAYAHVWTFRNGLVTRLEIFRQLDDALAAAGMSE